MERINVLRGTWLTDFRKIIHSYRARGNQTGNVLPSDVRERKSEVIDIGIDKFATRGSLIFREWEFRYARTSITKVEIMLAVTV